MDRALKTVIAASIFSLGSFAFANQAASEEAFLSSFYFKGEAGASLGGHTGTMRFRDNSGDLGVLKNTNLGLGGSFGIGAGTYITNRFRTELLFNYRSGNSLDTRLTNFNLNQDYDADISSYSFMAAGYFDIHTFQFANFEITPNVSALAGASINKSENFTIKTPGFPDIRVEGDTTTHFAWGLGAGAGVKLSEKLTLDLGYRYVDLGEFKSGARLISGASGNLQKRIEGDYATHELMMGVRFKF